MYLLHLKSEEIFITLRLNILFPNIYIFNLYIIES